MNRTDIAELHYICPIANMASICEKEILSHIAIREIGPKYLSRSTSAKTRSSEHMFRAMMPTMI